MLFPSPPRVRWWKTLPITFRRIWLVKTRPHAKCTRTVYPYIPVSGRYVNPSLEQPLYSYLLLDNLCAEFIIICISSAVQHATQLPDGAEYDRKLAEKEDDNVENKTRHGNQIILKCPIVSGSGGVPIVLSLNDLQSRSIWWCWFGHQALRSTGSFRRSL